MSDDLNQEEKMPMPLEGVRVVEYAVYHAGPGAGAILGDLGAEVIKIEEGRGDPERLWLDVGGIDLRAPDGQSIWYHLSNRNKKGICLNIETDMGREIFLRLIRSADVFLTNLRKSTKKKLRIDYEALSEINPRLVHANVSGFGPKGPLSDNGAFDPLGQGRSGMMFSTGNKEPALINVGVLDQATAIAASHAIVSALFFRERTGIGQEVHVSLYGTGMWLLYGNMIMNAGLGVDPNISWDRSKNSPLRNWFCCKDDKWIIGTHHPEERYWPDFCTATGKTELLDDPRFADKNERRKHCAELVEIFDEVFVGKTREEWIDILTSRGLMFGPVQRIQEVFEDPQSLANNYVTDFVHPEFGSMRIPGYPIHFSSARAETHMPAPTLGEHTDSIMRQLGFTDEEIQELRDKETIK